VSGHPAGCPVVDYNPFNVEGALDHMKAIDQLRASSPRFKTPMGPQGFYVFTDADSIRDALQHPNLFSNRAVTPLDPEPGYMWIPEMLDAPEHTKWRQLLAPHFTPAASERMEEQIRKRCVEMIEPLVGRTKVDFMNDFAYKFPATIFMELFGLPVDDLDMFMGWEHKILHGSPETDPDRSIAGGAMMDVMGYFAQLMAEKATNPGDDLLTKAMDWKIDGAAIPQDQMLAFCLLMFMAGLDTVTTQLSYSFLHLATHRGDRERIVNEPAIIPMASEEMLRAYAFVAPGRTATQDMEFHGVDFKKGEMVWLPLCGATRDPAAFPNADKVDFDRAENNHIAFGLGPHRCLGSHLARRELRIALEEWHARIPVYSLDESVHIPEHGGMFGLDALSLNIG
jgi:cytochrome P450